MKRIISFLVLFSFFSFSHLQAQFSVVNDFFNPQNNGQEPHGALITDGTYLYGMTTKGGLYDCGIIFKYDPATGKLTKLFDFDGTHGKTPNSSLFLDGNILYGTTLEGGSHGKGVVFKFSLGDSTYWVLHEFDGTDGQNPAGTPYVINGYLYGTAKLGGSSDHGVVFKINLSDGTFTLIHEFDGTDGYRPLTGFAYDGTYLYSVATNGGSSNGGVLFRIDPSNDNFTVLYNFTSATGQNPGGTPAFLNNFLYGMTTFGGKYGKGVIYRYDIPNNSYDTIMSFDGTNTFGSNGSFVVQSPYLYGLSPSGGTNNVGLVFKLSIIDNSYTVLANLADTIGSYPQETPCLLNDKLFATAYAGGLYTKGTIFCVQTNGTNLAKHIDFDGSDFANHPYKYLVSDKNYIYGITHYGGKNNKGIVFRIDKHTQELNKILDIYDVGGDLNYMGGIALIDDKLYISSYNGGDNNKGLIIQVDPSDFSSQVFYTFKGSDGSNPTAPLIADNNYLYGTTAQGGSNNQGTIFKINKSTGTLTILHEFNGSNGISPHAPLTLDGNILYGTTYAGGSGANYGLVFKYDLSTDTYTVLHQFNGSDGATPETKLLLLNDGYLYGTTTDGGTNDKGTIYRLQPDGSSFETLHEFDSSDGYKPMGDMAYDGTYLYGTTYQGAANNLGAIYRLEPNGNNFSNIVEFTSTQGSSKSNLLLDGNYLYGTAYSGGPYYFGTVYKYQLLYPEIEISTNSGGITTGSIYDFGTVSTSSSKTEAFTISNTSSDATLNLFGNPAIQLSQATAFTLVQFPAQSLAPGYTTTFQIKFTPTQAQVYHDTITIENDDADENPFIIYLTGTGTGTTTIIDNDPDNILIYPNPVANYLNIELAHRPITVTITDVAGHLLYRTNNTSTHMTLDLSHYSQSILILQITTSKGTFTRKIIKQ